MTILPFCLVEFVRWSFKSAIYHGVSLFWTSKILFIIIIKNVVIISVVHFNKSLLFTLNIKQCDHNNIIRFAHNIFSWDQIITTKQA